MTNVDALHLICESFLAGGPASRNGDDRNRVVIHIDEDVLTDDDPTGVCELDDGPVLAPETARRLACDAQLMWMVHRDGGTIVATSDAQKSISLRVRRIVRARDRGCRFPACGGRRFVDVHHVRHREHEGSNHPDNLIELCWFHHRLVHEGGWKLRLDGAGDVVVTNPSGNVIPTFRSSAGTKDSVLERNQRAGHAVTSRTITPRWYGDPLDLGHITTALWCADHRDPHRN